MQPFHTHINLDLLELCHLTCAMLLEVPPSDHSPSLPCSHQPLLACFPQIPRMSSAAAVGRTAAVSRSFRRLMDSYSRQVPPFSQLVAGHVTPPVVVVVVVVVFQVFQGPPETVRDYVLAAAVALRQGWWQKSVELVCGHRLWALLPDQQQVTPLSPSHTLHKV